MILWLHSWVLFSWVLFIFIQIHSTPWVIPESHPDVCQQAPCLQLPCLRSKGSIGSTGLQFPSQQTSQKECRRQSNVWIDIWITFYLTEKYTNLLPFTKKCYSYQFCCPSHCQKLLTSKCSLFFFIILMFPSGSDGNSTRTPEDTVCMHWKRRRTMATFLSCRHKSSEQDWQVMVECRIPGPWGMTTPEE